MSYEPREGMVSPEVLEGEIRDLVNGIQHKILGLDTPILPDSLIVVQIPICEHGDIGGGVAIDIVGDVGVQKSTEYRIGEPESAVDDWP